MRDDLDLFGKGSQYTSLYVAFEGDSERWSILIARIGATNSSTEPSTAVIEQVLLRGMA